MTDEQGKPWPWWGWVIYLGHLLHDEFWWPRKMSTARMRGLVAMMTLTIGTQATLMWAAVLGRADAAGSLLVTLAVSGLVTGCLIFVSEYEDDDPE